MNISAFVVCVVTGWLAVAVAGAAGKVPFDDAVAVWHMGDLSDAARKNSRLTAHGDVKVGIALKGAEREASLRRGGDGRVARFSGGHLSAGQGAGGELNLTGSAMTLAVRLRDPSGTWNCPLLAKHGGHGKLVYNLFSTILGRGVALGFEMGTTANKSVLRVSVPIDRIGPRDWHDVVCRADGAKLEMFIDGRCVDEDFILGHLRRGNVEPCLIGAESQGGKTKSGFRGTIDHAALWDRALSDEEILALSGGSEAVVRRARTDSGVPDEGMQYWRPPNNYYVGDCLPFFHDGTFRFFYLLDKNHHRAKNGLGAHQWAQAMSKDLVHWKHQPLAIGITEQWEGSICTGSAFHHEGTYYGFYATRKVDRTQHLGVAVSTDGIHFTKRKPNPFASPPPGYDPGHYRDPTVFQDKSTGLFHMLVTARLTDKRGGCLAHLTSGDLKTWKSAEPFLVTGRVPECPDHFFWNGWYYLVFSPDGLARYRMSRKPLGPWQKPAVDVFGSRLERVAKTAAFTGGRRLSVSFLADGGYAGQAVFRKLVQNADGTLGTKFPPELIPPTRDPIKLKWASAPGATVSDGGRKVALTGSPKPAAVAAGRLPHNVRITLRVSPPAKPGVFGLRAGGCELRIDTKAKTVLLGDDGVKLANVAGLNRPFTLDIILKDDIVDVCVDNRRTLIRRIPKRDGNQLVLFADAAGVVFDSIEVRPLLGDWAMGPFDKREQPVLTPKADSTFDCPVVGKPVRWESQNVYNPAAVVRDGKVHLLYRADDTHRPKGWGRTCRTGLAHSADGRTFTRHPTPVIYPDNDAFKRYEWEGGCEDIHVVQTESGEYVANYSTWTGKMDAMCVATSKDLVHWTKHGPAFGKAFGGKFVNHSRTGVVVCRRQGDRLIPAKINGKYWMYWRIGCFVATSENLIDWTPVVDAGGHLISALPPRNGHFDSGCCEAGAIALLTDNGILLMYNAINEKPAHGGDPDVPHGWAGLGQALFDPNNPTRALRRLDKPFLQARLPWERKGFITNAVVSNALVYFNGEWLLYYGAADRRIGLAALRGQAGAR